MNSAEATRAWAPASDPAAVLGSARLQAVLAAPAGIEAWVMAQQMALTAIPAPTGYEGLRAEWMLEQWRGLGLAADIDAAGNVVGELTGQEAEAPRLAVTAHLDTAFAPGTAVRPQQRRGRVLAPGIADNGAGLAGLLALIRMLKDAGVRPRRGVVFVATVGEEGEGDLRGMRHLFGAQSEVARRIGATLVLDGPGCEQITAGALPSRRLRLALSGAGGHSWSDLGQASAVHAAARVATALLAQIEPVPGVKGCNIGVMSGGSVVNAIAAEAELRVDLRARDESGLEEMSAAVRRALAAGLEQEEAAALRGRVRGRIEKLGERPGGQLPETSPLLRLVRAVDQHLGLPAREQAASTDANIPIAQGREALRVGAGGRAGGIHTAEEWFDPAGREVALRRLLLILLSYCGG